MWQCYYWLLLPLFSFSSTIVRAKLTGHYATRKPLVQFNDSEILARIGSFCDLSFDEYEKAKRKIEKKNEHNKTQLIPQEQSGEAVALMPNLPLIYEHRCLKYFEACYHYDILADASNCVVGRAIYDTFNLTDIPNNPEILRDLCRFKRACAFTILKMRQKAPRFASYATFFNEICDRTNGITIIQALLDLARLGDITFFRYLNVNDDVQQLKYYIFVTLLGADLKFDTHKFRPLARQFLEENCTACNATRQIKWLSKVPDVREPAQVLEILDHGALDEETFQPGEVIVASGINLFTQKLVTEVLDKHPNALAHVVDNRPFRNKLVGFKCKHEVDGPLNCELIMSICFGEQIKPQNRAKLEKTQKALEKYSMVETCDSLILECSFYILKFAKWPRSQIISCINVNFLIAHINDNNEINTQLGDIMKIHNISAAELLTPKRTLFIKSLSDEKLAGLSKAVNSLLDNITGVDLRSMLMLESICWRLNKTCGFYRNLETEAFRKSKAVGLLYGMVASTCVEANPACMELIHSIYKSSYAIMASVEQYPLAGMSAITQRLCGEISGGLLRPCHFSDIIKNATQMRREMGALLSVVKAVNCDSSMESSYCRMMGSAFLDPLVQSNYTEGLAHYELLCRRQDPHIRQFCYSAEEEFWLYCGYNITRCLPGQMLFCGNTLLDKKWEEFSIVFVEWRYKMCFELFVQFCSLNTSEATEGCNEYFQNKRLSKFRLKMLQNAEDDSVLGTALLERLKNEKTAIYLKEEFFDICDRFFKRNKANICRPWLIYCLEPSPRSVFSAACSDFLPAACLSGCQPCCKAVYEACFERGGVVSKMPHFCHGFLSYFDDHAYIAGYETYGSYCNMGNKHCSHLMQHLRAHSKGLVFLYLDYCTLVPIAQCQILDACEEIMSADCNWIRRYELQTRLWVLCMQPNTLCLNKTNVLCSRQAYSHECYQFYELLTTSMKTWIFGQCLFKEYAFCPHFQMSSALDDNSVFMLYLATERDQDLVLREKLINYCNAHADLTNCVSIQNRLRRQYQLHVMLYVYMFFHTLYGIVMMMMQTLCTFCDVNKVFEADDSAEEDEEDDDDPDEFLSDEDDSDSSSSENTSSAMMSVEESAEEMFEFMEIADADAYEAIEHIKTEEDDRDFEDDYGDDDDDFDNDEDEHLDDFLPPRESNYEEFDDMDTMGEVTAKPSLHKW